MSTESGFRKFFLDKHRTLCSKFELIGHDVPLWDLSFTGKHKTGDLIGFVDLVLKSGKRLYCAEIKYPKEHFDLFWDATKVIAYAEWYNFQRGIIEGHNKAYPMIFYPESKIRTPFVVLCSKLGIVLFGFTHNEEEDSFTVKKIT